MARRKRTITNGKLDEMLVWRIRQMIIEDQWSPEQIRGVLAKEGIYVSIQTIYRQIKAENCGATAVIRISDGDPQRSANRPKPPI